MRSFPFAAEIAEIGNVMLVVRYTWRLTWDPVPMVFDKRRGTYYHLSSPDVIVGRSSTSPIPKL